MSDTAKVTDVNVTKKLEEILVAKCANIGDRKNQQDYAIIPDENQMESSNYICVLCDGMGGLDKGEIASRMAAEHIFNSYYAQEKIDNKRQFLSDNIREADNMVSSIRDESGNSSQAGSTLLAVIINDGKLTWASVGDSRIYKVHEGNISQLTSDQNYGQVLLKELQNGNITVEQANADPMKDALTNYIGMAGIEEINMNAQDDELKDGDVIIMCSDGLYRTLAEEEIKKVVNENINNMPLASYLLVNEAISKKEPHQDNTTVILIKYSDKNLKIKGEENNGYEEM